MSVVLVEHCTGLNLAQQGEGGHGEISGEGRLANKAPTINVSLLSVTPCPLKSSAPFGSYSEN